MGIEKGKTLQVMLFPRKDYQETYHLQQDLLKRRIQGEIVDTLILVEHPPVITIGRGGLRDHLLVSEERLRDEGIAVLDIDRGGDITFHGPGQLVGYPILDLNQHQRDLHWLLRSYEEVFLRLLSNYQLQGERINGLTGVWVGNKKILALGIGVKRWVTFHGFSFNVNPTLHYFDYIVPCGIQEMGVTSLQVLLGEKTPPQEELVQYLLCEFQQVFSYARVIRTEKEGG